MKLRILLAAVLSLCLGTTMALAGTMPNLVGDWKVSGNGAGVVMGKLGHAEPTKDPQFLSVRPDFTLRINKQDGQRFHGEKISPKSKETVLGMIDDDGKSIYMVDDDGVYICTYDKSKDSLKTRYMEPGLESKVVAISVYTRVKK
ncbi:MAG: hypothetical protein PHD01_16820 [Geobacteraceae bacterium]|nr:hypothetical protein [Geobacteraceae bacterium]